MSETVFYLGAPAVKMLARTNRPLFVSYTSLRSALRRKDGTLKRRKKPLPDCRGMLRAWDSSSFTIEIRYDGDWSQVPARQYAEDMVVAYRETGAVDFWVPQDRMCEDFALEASGKREPGGRWPDRRTAVRAHQLRTVASYLELRQLCLELAPGGAGCPELAGKLAVALQGYFEDEYLENIDDYIAAGVDIAGAPRVVVGSMCKRKNTTEAATILRSIARRVGPNLHALGYATVGLAQLFGDTAMNPEALASADSQACYDIARSRHYIHPGCKHGKRQYRKRLRREEYGNCASCIRWGLWWADDVEAAARGLPRSPPPGIAHVPRKRGLPPGQLHLFSTLPNERTRLL